MKKRFLVLFLVLAIVLTLGIVAIAADGEETGTEGKDITITYVKDRSTMGSTSNLDTTAYSGGKQVVKAGEKFTLPTKSTETNTGVEGYQLIWYTQDGRTYKAGEEVSFEEDTFLFRCNAKECYTAAELGAALTGTTQAGILMADMEATSAISFPSWSTAVIIMNGFNLNFNTNSSGLIGEQRTQRHIYGEGTINVTNPDGKEGAYYFLKATNHGYAGDNSRTVIGRDVTINAPNHYLTGDESGDVVNRFVWTRIYGTINCYGLLYRVASNNCAPYTEFFEGCNVTFTGKQLIWDANSNGKFNYLGVDIAIYGGTFYLPAEAANESFWTNDNLETLTNYDGSKTYTNVGLTELNKDNIKIYGGSFVTADGSVPAIADYIENTYTGAFKTNGNGLVANSNSSTYEIPYIVRPGIKLVFTTYSASEPGTITVTDYVGSSLADKTFKYTMNALEDGSYEIIVYESRMDGDTEVWDVVSDELAIKYGLGGTILVSYDLTRENLELYNFEANNLVYQTVVPADCDHSFTGAPVDATCQSIAYADYNCPLCGHNVYFSWGEKAPHAYEAISSVAPTASTLGSSSFECSMCKDAKAYATTLDPNNFEITVTIKNDDGSFEEITALASDVFEFSTIGGNGAYIYTLSGIKAFGEYSIRNIYGVVIPNGIMYVNIKTHNVENYEGVDYGLEVLDFAENSFITIQNIGNLTSLKSIKAGKNSNIIFEANVSKYTPNGENRTTSKLEAVDFSAGDMYVKAMSSAFQDRPIKNLLLGGNSTYEFQGSSFRNIQITELVIPTSCTFIFGSNAFRDADITSLTFPDGTAESVNTWSFGDECFRYCPITSIELGQYGTYTFGSNSFANIKLTDTLTFAPNSTYTVSSWAFNSNQITIIDASAGNINLTVNGSGLKNLATVTDFKFGENSTYVFNGDSIGTTAYTKLTLAPNSTYTFNDNFLSGNTTITEIDASADNITINFNTKCFNGRTALSTLTFGKNATLTFNEDCFKDTALEGLTFFEGSTITINGYSMRNFAITELVIPENSIVTFGSNSLRDSNIQALTLSANSEYTFNNGSFNYATSFTEIVIPENSICLFKDWVFNTGSTIKKVDLSANNTTATFNSSSFRNCSSMETVLLNGNKSTYSFGQESFRNLKNLTVFDISGENSTYTATGTNVATDSTSITELVLGKKSTYIFEQYFVNLAPLVKLDASADGVNVTFKQNSFRGRPIETLLINGKNAEYTFAGESFRDCTSITELVLGEGSTYTFSKNSFYNASNISRIDATASNVTATFDSEVFSGRSSITYLAFGKNSTYTIANKAFYNCSPTNDVVFSNTSTFSIGQQAFYSNDFASITFEDECKVTFTGTEAFKECDKTVSLYIGKNIAITNYPFKNLKALEELYIMSGVTSASEYEFENAGSSDFNTPLYVYNHSTDIEFKRGMFNNCDGIILYTATNNIGTRTDVFMNCADGTGYKAYTVYLGIPYPELVKGEIAPSCEEYGYDTYVCNCGNDCGFYLKETSTIYKYENKHNITDTTEWAEEVGTYEVTLIDPAGHDILGELIYIVYNSYLENGDGTYICSACGTEHVATGTVAPIFVFNGYSTNLDNTSFSVGYKVDHEMLNKYERLTGNKLAYGVVAAITERLGGKAPLDEAVDAPVIHTDLPRIVGEGESETPLYAFDLVVAGFKAEYYDLQMTMSAYVKTTVRNAETGEETTEIVYIQGEQSTTPSSYSISEYLAPPPSNDEELVA